jgi:hypothetical protein
MAASAMLHYVVRRDIWNPSATSVIMSNATFVLTLGRQKGDLKILWLDPAVDGVWVCQGAAMLDTSKARGDTHIKGPVIRFELLLWF